MNGTDHHLINQLTRIKEALIEQNSHKHGVMQVQQTAVGKAGGDASVSDGK